MDDELFGQNLKEYTTRQIMQQNGLYIVDDKLKGRGVFAGVSFEIGDLIEICPVISLSPSERAIIHQTHLHDYYFAWGKEEKQAAIALGYGSLYNHSSNPNASFTPSYDEGLIYFECIQKINIGDEILINYIDVRSNEKLWFEEKN